jgi:hypothetical protein
MPKSYRITQTEQFNGDSFQLAPYVLDRQKTFEGMPPSPQTTIYKSRDKVTLEDFQRFEIVHEMEEKAWGRYSTNVFHSFIRKEYIHAFHSPANGMFLLSGKKSFVVDFCRKSTDLESISLKLFRIDMAQLLSQLPHVQGVWFRFPNGLIRASALMGANIESTADFQKYSSEGEISTLSFYFEHGGITHPIMVVSDCTVVLYSNYAEISMEIDLILSVMNSLLKDIMEIHDP